jgi:predicted  nucleic acid-binding Zn-ribbon protein
MSKTSKTLDDPLVLEAALEGLELQKQRIEAQIREVRSRLGRRAKDTPDAAFTAMKKRNLSPDARKRIAAAQKKRWAEYRKGNGNSK